LNERFEACSISTVISVHPSSKCLSSRRTWDASLGCQSNTENRAKQSNTPWHGCETTDAAIRFQGLRLQLRSSGDSRLAGPHLADTFRLADTLNAAVWRSTCDFSDGSPLTRTVAIRRVSSLVCTCEAPADLYD
jgi:hypothetical protein